MHSIAHVTTLNIFRIILAELFTRLTMPLDARGKEILFPRFIMCILNYKYCCHQILCILNHASAKCAWYNNNPNLCCHPKSYCLSLRSVPFVLCREVCQMVKRHYWDIFLFTKCVYYNKFNFGKRSSIWSCLQIKK